MTAPEKQPVTIPEEERWKVQLEDWKMAKERINQFDQTVVRIRMTGIPIILVIIGVGLTLADRLSGVTIPVFSCTGAAVPFLFAGLYILPVAMLDYVHYRMLQLAVEHAKSIENSDSFQGLLGLTNRLTTKQLNTGHFSAAMLFYALLFILTVLLAYIFWNGAGSFSGQSEAGLLGSVL
ncbi:MAG: hypothetical protein LUQ31_07835 [Methanoregula sp.]|nr:hypothetical protein [Methanoregula sp.]